tara:strand:- start:1655 stop:1876 length:222 start_codon:yes stop_codon:yes gene_type:complete
MDRDAYRKKIFELDRKIVRLQATIKELEKENLELKAKLKTRDWCHLSIGDVNDFKKEMHKFRDNALAAPFDIE